MKIKETLLEFLSRSYYKSEDEEQRTPGEESVPKPEEADDVPEDEIDDELGGEEEHQDRDKMGLIRRVANAHLVYKRQEEDGTYTELWLYHDDVIKSAEIRREIIAGTDIDINTGYSEDKLQTYEIWSPGNCEMMEIRGLPS